MSSLYFGIDVLCQFQARDAEFDKGYTTNTVTVSQGGGVASNT
jgi:hypothetical protein